MSLQISSAPSNVVNQVTQAAQNYHYAPVNKRLDPITEQIVKTKDAALEVMNLIESGAVSKFWEDQKKLPSATWLGNVMDWFLGWGNYYPETKKRNTLEEEKYEPWPCPTDNVYRYNMTTSYEVQINPDNSCAYLNSTDYKILTLKASVNRPIRGPEDIICRIDACVVYYLKACNPNCLPCQNATDSEKTLFLNETKESRTFFSGVDWLVWRVDISTLIPDSKINKWKRDQIFNLFNTAFASCVDKNMHPEIDSRWYYTLLIIPVASLGTGIGVYIKCRSKKKAEEYTPVDNIQIQ